MLPIASVTLLHILVVRLKGFGRTYSQARWISKLLKVGFKAYHPDLVLTFKGVFRHVGNAMKMLPPETDVPWQVRPPLSRWMESATNIDRSE